MSTGIQTKYLIEPEFELWAKFVADSPDGSIYSTPEYLDALCEATGGHFKILAALQGDDIVGGVCLYEESSLFGKYISPRLLLYYNGIVLRDYETKFPSQKTSRHLKIISDIEEKLQQEKYASIMLKCRSSFTDARIFQMAGWNVKVTYTYVVYCDDLDNAWDRIEQNIRRLIKRCIEQGIVITEDNDFDSLYRMHIQTHDRKGSPIYLPYEKFKRYFEKLKSHNLCRLYHARLPNGKSISSQLVLIGSHPVTHSVCASADEDYLSSGASAFLRWKVLEDLSKHGYRANDLTDAALNPVTRFKSQLGADLQLCLVLTKPEKYMFRLNRTLKSVKIKYRTRLANFIKRIIGRDIEDKNFRYWQ